MDNYAPLLTFSYFQDNPNLTYCDPRGIQEKHTQGLIQVNMQHAVK